MPLNFEFKTRSLNNRLLEQHLQAFNPSFAGEDFQTDTYFNALHGRLKLREGKMENALIHYHREDVASAKQSTVLLYQHAPDSDLKAILAAAMGVKVIVKKRRRIWFVQNIKFHFDHVEGLGEFVEVEAIDSNGTIGIDMLKEQCLRFAKEFSIKETDYLAASYSDLLLENR